MDISLRHLRDGTSDPPDAPIAALSRKSRYAAAVVDVAVIVSRMAVCRVTGCSSYHSSGRHDRAGSWRDGKARGAERLRKVYPASGMAGPEKPMNGSVSLDGRVLSTPEAMVEPGIDRSAWCELNIASARFIGTSGQTSRTSSWKRPILSRFDLICPDHG